MAMQPELVHQLCNAPADAVFEALSDLNGLAKVVGIPVRHIHDGQGLVKKVM